MSYEYMKEYHCKIHKPQLPDDVEVDILEDNVWMGERKFKDVYWKRVYKFRIVDERYKPKAEQDVVHHPKHYQFFDGIEAIEVIASSMTVEQFRGYCMGNKMKYCLRAGKKGDATEDLQKADKYDELFHKYEHLCRQ